MANGQKKRGSLSRVKSTPKEEGGGDKSEPKNSRLPATTVRTLRILPEATTAIKQYLCIAQVFLLSNDNKYLYISTN
jgi:hypothetical protein